MSPLVYNVRIIKLYATAVLHILHTASTGNQACMQGTLDWPWDKNAGAHTPRDYDKHTYVCTALDSDFSR